MIIDILPHQKEFIFSTHTHTILLGGYGSGKSISGTLKSIKKHTELKTDVAYYLPTYPLIKKIAYKNFKYWLNKLNIQFTLNRQDHEITTDFGSIIFQSMDRPENIVGYEVGYSLIDEVDTIAKSKMQDLLVAIVARNRLPLKNGEKNQLDFVSTPEGYGFLYDFVVKQKKGFLIKAKTRDNPYLPEEYINTLANLYNEKQLQAYLNAEFVNLTSGNVYEFDRNKNHADREIKEREVLHVGLDFNVGNMSAIIHVIENGKKYAVDELCGILNTFEMAEQIKHNFKGYKIVVYPDASGSARKTSATETDLQILRKAGFSVRVDKSNPPVKERINFMNYAFRNDDYFVNTNKCINYTEALENLAYKNGQPDKQSGYDHLTDAGGYFLMQQKKVIKIRTSRYT